MRETKRQLPATERRRTAAYGDREELIVYRAAAGWLAEFRRSGTFPGRGVAGRERPR
jgi:hypothetical protein